MPRTYTGNVWAPFQTQIDETSLTKDYTNNNPETQLHAFQPKYSQQQVEMWAQQYKAMPSIFNEQTIQDIEEHSQHYGMMFNRNLEDEEFRLFDMVKQAGAGWVSGFTTLEIGEQPKNEWEGIARNLGHLGGFIGVIPGVSTVANITGSSILKGIAKLQGKSVPMLIAGQATKRAKTLASGLRNKAIGDVNKAKGTAYEIMHNKIANDVIEGAFHLGTASAVSSWTHGVDAMISSAMHGAAFGGVFRGIGNFLKSGVKGEQALGENLVGSIAGSLFQGLPATARGATTKEQIYEYVMGAYFGFKESPYYTRTGQKYGAELTKYATEKKWPVEKLEEKVAEDLLKRNWDSKERAEAQNVADVVIGHQKEVQRTLQDAIRRDPTLRKKIEAMGYKVTPQGEQQALPDTPTRITDPSRLLPAGKTKPTKEEVLKEDYQDTGTLIEYDGISSAVKAEAERNLSSSWKKKGQPEDLFLKRDKVDKLQKKLNEMVEKKSEDVEELAKWLKKEYDYDITGQTKESLEGKAFYTNYLVRRNNMKPIKISSPHVTINYTHNMDARGKWWSNMKDITFEVDQLSPEMPKNRANDNKAVDSPLLFVEQVYVNEMGKRNKTIDLEDPNQRPIERVDSFTMIGQPHGNFSKTYQLSKLKELISGDVASSVRLKARTKGGKKLSKREIDERISRETERHVDRFVGEVTKHYEGKGMHYLSGRGDGDLSYYIKYHPSIAKRNKAGINKKYNQVKKLLEKSGVPKVEKFLEEDMAEYVEKYGDVLGKNKAKEIFKKTYVSNHMWEMANNGLRPNRILEGKDPAIQFTEGFIGNAIAFNKRQQVWLTNGVPLNETLMTSRIKDLGFDANGNPFARTILFELPKSNKKPWERDALDQAEHFDGGTPIRTDVVDAANEAVGHPIESGVTKNFIVSPDAKHGALLYKHMMFDAGKTQSDIMRNQELAGGEKGIHFFSPRTSTKQVGHGRESYYITKEGDAFKYVNSKTGEIVDKPKAYYIPIKDMRTVMSEKTSDHNIGQTRIPKQLGTNLLTTLYHSPGTSKVTKDLIDGWFKDHHLESFHGNKESNALLDAYRKDPTPENLDKVMKNFEDISTPEIVKLMTEPGYEEFSAKAYDRMARIVREQENHLRQEGEEGNAEASEIVREADTFKSTIERNLGLSEAGDLGVYLHKMTDPYRQKVIRSYVVNNITRPKMDNGMTARMTVYDWELQERFPELKTDKNVYYLGDSMRNKDISKILKRRAERDEEGIIISGYDGLIARLEEANVPSTYIAAVKNQKTLGKLWDYRQRMKDHKKAKKEIDAFFEGINVRVPMDSGSGAHVLRFGGFMGRKGYNVLMHPESMKALGGADSDGDKAFIFFDMKPQYKDAFKNARDEFVEYKHKTKKDVKLTKLEYEKLPQQKTPDYSQYVDPGWATMKAFGRRLKVIEHLEKYNKTKSKPAERQLVYDLMGYLEGYNKNTFKNHPIKDELQQILTTLNKEGYRFGWDANGGVFRLSDKQGNAWSNRPKGAPRVSTKNTQNDYYPVVSDNKAEFKNQFTVEGENPKTGKPYTKTELKEFKERNENRALMYSPLHRHRQSSNAAGGRGNLGPAVVSRQVLGATHAAMIDAGLTSKSFTVGKKGEEKTYTMRPKTKEEEMAHARKVARASIAFPSDPLDEVGLVHRDVAFKNVFESFFEITDSKGKKVNDPKVMRKGMNEIFSKINSAFFGRDEATGKQWTYEEMKEKSESVNDLPAEGRNSVLAKVAETINPIDWRDNLADRINWRKLDEMYDAHAKFITDYRGKEGDINSYHVAQAINRSGFPITINAEVRSLENGQAIRGTESHRESLDYLSNDIHQMVAFRRGLDYWIKSYENGTWRDIGKFVDNLYAYNYQQSIDASIPFNTVVKVRGKEMELRPREFLALDKKLGKGNYEIVRQEMRDTNVKKEGQDQINTMIRDFKKTLNENDKKALDWFLVSGFKVPAKSVKERWNEIKDTPGAERDLLFKLVHGSSQTRFAFSSPEVNDAVIKQFWTDYAKTFKGLKKPRKEVVEKDIDGARDMVEKGEGSISGKRARIEVDDYNSSSPTPDINESINRAAKYKKVLGDLDAFKRISEMKDLPELSSETKKLRDRLITALDKQSNKIGGDLELFIRYEFGKEADQLTMLELKSLVNMLESPGTWYQENRAQFHMNVKTGKPDAPKVSKWVHMMFPRSIDRLWLSKEMKLVEASVPAWHKNKKGEWTMDFVKGMKPMHKQGELQWLVSNNQRISIDQQTIEEARIMSAEHAKENLSWLASIPEADVLHEYAIMRLEYNTGKRLDAERDRGGAAAYEYYKLRDPKSELSKKIAEIGKKNFKAIFDRDPVNITGEEAMKKIEQFWRNKNDKDFDYWLKGKKEHIEKYFYYDKYGVEHARVEDFVKDVTQALRNGQKPHEVIRLGNDHMNKMATHVQIRNESNPKFRQALYDRLKFFNTEYRKDFFHHTRFDQSELKKALDVAIENVKKAPAGNQKKRQELVAEAARLAFHLKNVTGELNLDAFKNWHMYEILKTEVANKVKEKDSLAGLSAMFTHASQNKRSLNVKGWDRSPQAGIDYAKGQVETYYNNLSQIMGRETIRQFELDQVRKYKKDGKIIDKEGWENAKAWKNIFEMYLNESLGFPSVIPEHVLNNPNMKLKGTPYAWWADSNVKNRINKIADALGVKNDADVLGELGQYMDYNKLRGWTNLEAKYQLATLLAHPKTAIANVFGGTSLTIQSVGLRHWRNARNHQYLRDNVDPTFTTKEDAGRWVESLGVIEQFLRYELGLNPALKSKRIKEGVEKIFKKLRKEPGMDDVTLRQAWKETGLSDNLFNKAAYFMRKSERILRRDSFLAHYLQAKDMFGEAISGKGSRDHPFLIEWARRGVQDTQFLYTAAFRPAFARSALGKVMTRFQLWAWNSVAFRNKVLREANHYGFKEGTPEFERFKRTASIDLMVFGLANAFTYSLFEANLPAPYNWMQDTADWLFGNQKTRDRAFFGAYPNELAPLQMITPPAGRLIGPTMKAMIDDDWSKMSNYYVWTMFPFGRMARDVKNSVQNPIRTVENLTGIPYIAAHRYLKETRTIGEEE